MAMINRIIDLSVEHRLIVFLLVAAACITGWWSMQRMALDAVPDLSDTQVIVFSRWDRSPDIIEDQVTYPIVSAMLGAPKVKTVRFFHTVPFRKLRLVLRMKKKMINPISKRPFRTNPRFHAPRQMRLMP